PYATFHEIAHRVILGLLLGNRPFLDQDFHMAVIPGPGQHASLPHLVDAAVANVPPERPALLDEADGAGRAWTEIHRDIEPQAHHLIVRSRERRIQEALRVENRQACGRE